jgi:putative transposase
MSGYAPRRARKVPTEVPMAHGARQRLRDAVAQLERRLPKIAALLEDAEADVLAFYPSPAEHWPKIRSTNPLERFNRESV